jgi:hypothetical protein
MCKACTPPSAAARRRGDPFAGGGAAEVRKATLTILLADARTERPRKQGIENDIRAALEPCPACAARWAWAARAKSTCWC